MNQLPAHDLLAILRRRAARNEDATWVEVAARLSLLHRLALEMPTARNRQELFERVTSLVQEHMGVLNNAVSLIEGDEVVLQVVKGGYEPWVRERGGFRQPVGVGTFGTVAQTGVSLLVEDARKFPGFAFIPDEGSDPCGTELDVPMAKDGRIFGVLGFQRERPGSITPLDIYVFEAVGSLLAAACVGLEAKETVEREAARRQDLERVKHHYLRNITHEVQTPLAVVRGYLELLNMGKVGGPERSKEVLGTCLHQLDRLGSLLDQTLGFVRTDWRTLQFHVQSAADFVEGIRASLGVEDRARLRVAVEGGGDFLCVRSVLQESLGSLLRARVAAGGRVDVTVSGYRDRYLMIQVEEPGGPDLEHLAPWFIAGEGVPVGDAAPGPQNLRQALFTHGGFLEEYEPEGGGFGFRCLLPRRRDASEGPRNPQEGTEALP